MIGDPRPVLGLAEDRSDVLEAQLAEDPQFEDLPVGFLQRVQRQVDPEGGILIRRDLLDALSVGLDILRDRPGLLLPAFLIIEQVFRDRTEPGA